MQKVLMVCTGNICRSPTADGVLRHLIAQHRLEGRIEVDSAGTQSYHVGEAPDRRSQKHAKQRGYDLSKLRARQVQQADYAEYDLILAMDRSHLNYLTQHCPAAYQQKIKLFLSFASQTTEQEVPDPYYGGEQGFEYVLDLVEDACQGILQPFLQAR
ncbi:MULTISPECIES: low molecular weight protein-tyrosine-phosphatase [Deefgea]|uniref:protein-tyrosine-phosphatase n=1 Tax=Deefgea chitinilytica TaxID=570276 RepID=A0ABS2C935_9NEIS|nr:MULTISPECIES: low molecular weight protein-tyrosine-phosphatase [Deefgea]MBM5570669.1 low molecular weight phosphotyrosine protein phosphatase [Deefgea chitinilytica]MBM9887898.1 low molecular weight phosphotyrosine protein phosphatase [Deefgea sp. CFH1-16]